MWARFIADGDDDDDADDGLGGAIAIDHLMDARLRVCLSSTAPRDCFSKFEGMMNTEVSALGVFLRMCAKHRKAIGYWIPNNLRKNPAILRSFSPQAVCLESRSRKTRRRRFVNSS